MDKLSRMLLIALAILTITGTLLPQERKVCAGEIIYTGEIVGVDWPIGLHSGPVNIYLWKSSSKVPKVLVADYRSELGQYSWNVAEDDTSEFCRIIIGSRGDSNLTAYPASFFRIKRKESLQKANAEEIQAIGFEIHLYPNPIKNEVLQFIVSDEIKNIKIVEKSTGRVLYDRTCLASRMGSVDVSGYPAGSYFVIASSISGHQLTKSFVVVK